MLRISQCIRRAAGLIVLLPLFFPPASAKAQMFGIYTYNEQIDVTGLSGTLSYTYSTESFACPGGRFDRSDDGWSSFSWTPSTGSTIKLDGQVADSTSCTLGSGGGLFGSGGTWEVNGQGSDSDQLTLFPAIAVDGEFCNITFAASGPQGTAIASCNNGSTGWPAPPATATSYENLQDGSWTLVYGRDSNGNALTGSSCDWSDNPDEAGTESESAVQTPSLSGNSLDISDGIGNCTPPLNQSNAEWNVLNYQDLCGGSTGTDCPSTAPSNYEFQVSFYVPPGVEYQALEFDPDITFGGNTYWASLQCDSASGDWRISIRPTTAGTPSHTEIPRRLYPARPIILGTDKATGHGSAAGTISGFMSL